MAWTPTETIIHARAIPDNLLAYIEANQEDALVWASGSAMKPIAEFSSTVANRDVPVFPSIAYSDDNDAADYTETLPIGAYSVVLEVMVNNSDPSIAVTQARSYAKAIVSMIRNCPPASLLPNTGLSVATLQTIETGFDPIKTNEMQNDFLQMFQIRAVYNLQGE